MDLLKQTEAPYPMACVDMAEIAYRRADALVELVAIAGYGLEKTGDPTDGGRLDLVTHSIRLQLEIGCFASRTQFAHCRRFSDSHEDIWGPEQPKKTIGQCTDSRPSQ